MQLIDEPSRNQFLLLYLLLWFGGVNQVSSRLGSGTGSVNCKQICDQISFSVDVERAADQACHKMRAILPNPTTYEFCLGIFISTYPSVCMNSCNEENDIVPFDCFNQIRKATTDITRKNALNACKTGRSGAIQWMVSRFDEYKNLYFAEKDSHLWNFGNRILQVHNMNDGILRSLCFCSTIFLCMMVWR